jgi:hypothetical protein
LIGDVGANEGATDPLAGHLDIIGPFDLKVIKVLNVIKAIADGQREGLGELELAVGAEKGRVEHKAEGEVFAGCGLPVVAALANAGSLLQRPITSKVLHLSEVEDFTILICRGHRGQFDNGHRIL